MHQTEECAQPDALKLNSQNNYYNFSVILFYPYRKISGVGAGTPSKLRILLRQTQPGFPG